MDFFYFIYVAQQITAFNLYAEKDPQTRLLEQMEKREIRQKAHIKMTTDTLDVFGLN